MLLCATCLEGCFFSPILSYGRLGGQLEVGHGFEADSPNSGPADILVPNWMIGKPASPLNSNTLNEAGAAGMSADRKAKTRKHNANDRN